MPIFHGRSGRLTTRSTTRPRPRSVMVATVRASASSASVARGTATVRRPGGDGDDGAGGDREPQDPVEESGSNQVDVGCQREEQAGEADAEGADQRELARQERELDLLDADDRRQQHGVHRLGDEEVGDPFDVVDDLAALRRAPREGGEAVVEQHQLRDRRAMPSCPLPMAMPMSESFSASTSLTPSPVMATTRTAGLQGADHGPLLVGGDPSEHRDASERVGQLVGIVGELAGVDACVRRRGPRPVGHGGDRGDVVAGDHLQIDTLVGEVRAGSRERRDERCPRAGRGPPARVGRGRSVAREAARRCG